MSDHHFDNDEPRAHPRLPDRVVRGAPRAPRDARAGTPRSTSSATAEPVADGAGALAGGHLGAVLHATRSSELPADDLASIREHTQAPIVLLASGEATALLEDALDADVADVLLLPQLTENVVFAIRKAAHAGRRAQQRHGQRRPDRDRLLPEGRDRQDRHGDEPRRPRSRSTTASARCCSTSTSSSATRRSCSGSSPTRRSRTWSSRRASSIRRSSRATRPGTRRASTSSRRRCGPRTPSSSPSRSSRACSRSRKQSYDVIVVDTSPFFHGPMLATLDRTDELLLLCGLDVPTIKNVRLSIQTLELLSFPPERIRVVLNRANSNVGMKRSEVEAALEAKVRFELPSDRAVPLAVNRGNPAVLADAGCDFSRGVRDMAKGLLVPDTGQGQEALARAAGEGVGDGPPRPHQRAGERQRPSSSRTAASRSPRRPVEHLTVVDPYAELKTRVHHACIAKLGPELFTTRDDRGPDRPRHPRGHRGADARPDAAHPRGAPRARPRDHRRHPRLRPARAVPPRRLGHGDHGQQLRPDLRRARGQDRAHRARPSSTTPTCCGSSTRSSRRSAAGSTRRRRWSTRASRTAAA